MLSVASAKAARIPADVLARIDSEGMCASSLLFTPLARFIFCLRIDVSLRRDNIDFTGTNSECPICLDIIARHTASITVCWSPRTIVLSRIRFRLLMTPPPAVFHVLNFDFEYPLRAVFQFSILVEALIIVVVAPCTLA